MTRWSTSGCQLPISHPWLSAGLTIIPGRLLDGCQFLLSVDKIVNLWLTAARSSTPAPGCLLARSSIPGCLLARLPIHCCLLARLWTFSFQLARSSSHVYLLAGRPDYQSLAVCRKGCQPLLIFSLISTPGCLLARTSTPGCLLLDLSPLAFCKRDRHASLGFECIVEKVI